MKKTPCLYCGNSQTNHTVAWIDEAISIGTMGFNRRLSRWWPVRKGVRMIERATPAILAVLGIVRIVAWNDDIEKVKGLRGKVLWEEAVRRGFSVRNLILFGRHVDTFEATRGGKRIIYSSVPTGDVEDRDSFWWMDDKALLKKRLEAAGIPVARGGSYALWFMLKKRFRSLTRPVIVKPRVGSRGRHTFTAIYTEDELRRASRIARQVCPFVMLEEHLIGSVYRGTIVDGEVVAVLRGDPPRVTGDGVSTIAELVRIKNENRDSLVGEVVFTPEHLDFLARNGYTPDSVIPAGKTIDVLSKVGLYYGGGSEEVTPIVHPKIFRYLAEAAKAIDYPIIGFDFIIEDAGRDPDTQRWGIIEANSAPFINLHHYPLHGAPVNVAAKVWDMVERKRFS